MSRKVYLRLLLISFFAAFILSVGSMLTLMTLTEQAANRPRTDFLLFFSGSIEDRLSDLAPADFNQAHLEARLHEDHFGPPPGPRPGGHQGPHFNYWLVGLDNKIIFTPEQHGPADIAIPDMALIPHPSEAHVVEGESSLWPLSPTTSVVRLNTKPVVYLVAREEHGQFIGTLFKTQAALTFATVLAALLIALSLMFIYLQRKSAEARSVLLRLGQGDLQARFAIRRFDEFGGLLMDFNRMAEEIEHLVTRIRETETVRKNLLQELGHDLRTPLTSLTTSFETLQEHGDKMRSADRADLFIMISAEISYFKDLLEKLMTIASLDEPHYRNSSEVVDLSDLLASEVRTRGSVASKLKWRLDEVSGLRVLGDEHLLQRLLRNALENAGRYARTAVDIRVSTSRDRDRDMLNIEISDDGPGLSDEELQLFGKRREKRRLREQFESEGLNFSLGLGSVIMKTITHLHHGHIKIENKMSQNEKQGARLLISLPLVDDKKSVRS